MDLDLMRSLAAPADTKILLCVVDGLGGLPHPDTKHTELESASIPNLNHLAEQSSCGLTIPVGSGITPGSGPGHLALFGYDPLKYEVGRGVLEALGIDFDLRPTDVAARGNFCTVDGDGNISDRRAGRISTETMAGLVEQMRSIRIPGVEIFVEPVREHRFVVVFRGEGLDDRLRQTDPERGGVPPLAVTALRPEAEPTATIANRFIEESRRILSMHPTANMVLLRGFAKHPDFPPLPEVTGMRCGAFAVYPMYRGLAKLVGMTVAPGGGTYETQLAAMKAAWQDFDFFFFHFKKADAAGEDGNFRAKVEALEEFDALIPKLRELNADVMIVAGDHSTPAVLAAHSWHPVPFMISSPFVRADRTYEFTETNCREGALGTFPAVDVMPLALANAGRTVKFGA
jgi:2,3-bisphosphoglycerate-independent phosphoglycerate mutase